MRKLTDEQARTKLAKASNSTITALEVYQGHESRWFVQCRCGHKWKPFANHLLRGHGCIKCSSRRLQLAFLQTDQKAKDRLFKIFGGAITPLEPYSGSRKRWAVQCLCGHKWKTHAHNLFSGKGCRKCRDRKTTIRQLYTDEEAKKRVFQNFRGTIIPLGPYLGSNNRWAAECQCGRKWKPYGRDLLRGHGCKNCSVSGFQASKAAIAYYVRISTTKGYIYKIGVTNRTVTERFAGEKLEIECLKTWNFKTGLEALAFEQRILKDNKAFRYRGIRIFKYTNTKELFSWDVLGLDKPKQFDLFTTPEADSGRPTSKAA